jgi:hypothetical protein
MYGIYNTIAFNDENETARTNYRIIRSSVIKNYLTLFLAGKGTAVNGVEGAVDFASFLVVNGHYYSMASIVLAIQKELEKKDSTYGSRPGGDLVYLNVTGRGKSG